MASSKSSSPRTDPWLQPQAIVVDDGSMVMAEPMTTEMNPDLSGRIVEALRPLQIDPVVRYAVLVAASNAATFRGLPAWTKDLVKYGERYVDAPIASVSVPRRIVEAAMSEASPA